MGWTDPEIIVIGLLGIANLIMIAIQLRQNGKIADITKSVGEATIEDLRRKKPKLRAEELGSRVILSGALEIGLRIWNEGTDGTRLRQDVEHEVETVDGSNRSVGGLFYKLNIWVSEHHTPGPPGRHLHSRTAPEIEFDGPGSKYVAVTFLDEQGLEDYKRIAIRIEPRVGEGTEVIVDDIQALFEDWRETDAGRAVESSREDQGEEG